MSRSTVSFIIVNYNGIEHLKECFSTLKNLDYPKENIEYIMVDNGSSDGSVNFVQKNFPYVSIIKNDSNEGFAKPNNDAAKIATGEYLALINNDMRLDKNWLNDMFNTLESCGDDKYKCVGSRILNWDGTKLDFAGGSVNFAGYGYQFDYGMDIKEADTKYTEDQDILFACGGSLLISREVFLEAGGFDEDYFAYYEDVDLGWRLWILGYKVRFCAKAKCFHKHNSTSKKFNTHKMKMLFERNALYTIYKNYSNENFDLFMCNLLLMMQRLQMDLGIKTENFDIKVNKQVVLNLDESIENYSPLVAINELSNNLYKLNIKRKFIQENRKIADLDLKRLMPNPLMPFPVKYFHDFNYLDIFQRMITNFNVEEKLQTKFKRKVLLVSNEKIGPKMAGPGIRYWEFAKELCKYNDVTLAIPNANEFQIENENLSIIEYSITETSELIKAAWESDILIIQGLILELVQELKNISKQKILIVDVYDPFVIEVLETYKGKSLNNRLLNHNQTLRIQVEQLALGDYFICASDKQMDLWIGMLSTLNKVNPYEYDLSYNLDKLIGLVPFGVSTEEPKHTRNALSGKMPGLKDTDKVLIWGGGIWNWFDPITLIKAVNEISKVRDDVKLFFLGVKHPNPAVPEMEMCNEAIKLSEELDLRDKFVFFNMDWVDYDDRQNYLLESFAGVSCHLNNLETRYSFRTRILDYLWARLPIITTEGDYFADLVEKKEIGIVVPYNNSESLANAILSLVNDETLYNKYRNNIDILREEFKWDRVMSPLIDFCNNPIKKKNLEGKGNDDYIIDLEQDKQDSNIGQFLKGRKVGQKFNVRYPNFSSVEIRVATYARKNPHKIRFELFEAKTNKLLAEKVLDASIFPDNSWVSIDFSPIINSEGREFYFYLESDTEKYDNCITIWKNSNENQFGSLMENGRVVKGSLTFRTKCIYSKKPLNESHGIILPDSFENIECDESLQNYDSSDISVSLNTSDKADMSASILSKVNRIQLLEKRIKQLENTLSTLQLDVNRTQNWIENTENKIRIIKKVNFVTFLRRLFNR